MLFGIIGVLADPSVKDSGEPIDLPRPNWEFFDRPQVPLFGLTSMKDGAMVNNREQRHLFKRKIRYSIQNRFLEKSENDKKLCCFWG